MAGSRRPVDRGAGGPRYDLRTLSVPSPRTASRPVIANSQAISVLATGVALALALSGLFYHVQSRWAAVAMMLVVAIAGAIFMRMLGAVQGSLVLLIATSMIDQWVFAAVKVNIRPEQIAALIALGVLVMAAVRHGREMRLRASLPELLLIVWFGVGLASSVLTADDRFESLKILLLLTISSAAMVLPRRLIENDAAVMDQVVAWLLLAFAMEAAYATATYFLHLFGPTVALTVNPASGHLDAKGTMWEPNVLGAISAAGAVAWTVLGPRHFRHAWIGIALCLAACAVSFTRAAWVAVALLLMAGLATPVRRRLDIRVLGTGLLATVALVIGVVVADRIGRYNPGRPDGTISAVGNPTDILGRINQFAPVFHDLMERKLRLLIGGGIDSFGQRHVLDGIPEHLANLELSVLNDTGVLGVLIFGAFGVSIVLAVWRTRHDLTVLGLASMMLMLALTNTATQTLELMITWLLTGLLLAAVEVAETASAEASVHTVRGSAA